MKHKQLRALCEGAIMVALATALSYLKLLELPQGGRCCWTICWRSACLA